MSKSRHMGILAIGAGGLLMLITAQGEAGGGAFPTYPGGVGYVLNNSTQVTAVIVLDPNGPVSSGAPSTLTGTFGTIAVTRKGVGTAVAPFRVEPASSLGELRFGCNLSDTNPRFVEFAPGAPGLPLGGPSVFTNWLPTDVTIKLFDQLGVALLEPVGNPPAVRIIPGITGVVSQRCDTFPRAKGPLLDNLPLSGIVNLNVNPLPPTYPDRTIPEATDPTQQWFPGILVLEVHIGFWAQPGIPTP